MRRERALSATVARAVTWEPGCHGGCSEAGAVGTSRHGGPRLPQGARRLDG